MVEHGGTGHGSTDDGRADDGRADDGRTRLPVGERREQLMRRGLELFSRVPYDAVSIDDIAEAAGISKGLLYHYFPSKRDFYVAVVREAVGELIELTEPDPSLPPDQRLRASLDAYLDYVQRHREGYLAVMQGGIGADPEVREVVERMRGRTVERIVEGLGVGAPSPTLVIGLRGWVGFVEGAVAAWLDGQDMPRADLIDMCVGVVTAILASAASLPTDGG